MRGLLSCAVGVLCGTLGLAAAPRAGAAQTNAPDSSLSIELIDPQFLRVCADPNDLPFSNEKGEGFENKLAELFARLLNKRLTYAFYPQATGFVRNTLSAHRCDVIMGFPQEDELVQSTNPYYHTTYALLVTRGSGLDVRELADPRLREARIGIIAGTPPATILATRGMMARAKSYPLMIDTRVGSTAAGMIRDLQAGDIQAGVLWGPIAGFYAKRTSPELHVIPLLGEKSGPRLDFRISMGVRATDQDWKRLLNSLIQAHQPEINSILAGYSIPLLDDKGRLLDPGAL